MFSDVKTNASVALDNLLSLVDGAGELPLESQAIQKGSSLIDLVSQGEEILGELRVDREISSKKKLLPY